MRFLPKDLQDLVFTSPRHAELARQAKHTLTALSGKDLASTIVAPKFGGGYDVLAVLAAAPVAGFLEVFIFPSVEIKRHPVTFWKDLKREIARVSRSFSRVSSVSEDTPALRRFFSHLGFELVGPARRPECEGMVEWRLA